MLERYCEADFSIFVRPDRRSSHAGFPTKLAESLAAGTPVITNNTGDIGLYLKDGENGFLLKDGTQKSVKDVLDKLIQIEILLSKCVQMQDARHKKNLAI